jgi:hypothetical protein
MTGTGARVFIALAVTASLSGCSAVNRGAIKEIGGPPSVPIDTSSYPLVVLDVKSDLPDSKAETKMLEGFLADRFAKKRIFDRVILPGMGGDLPDHTAHVAVVIKKLRRVEPTDRIAVGAFAGSARVIALVEVTESGTGKRLDTFEAEGVSAMGTILTAYQGDTSHALESLADQVVERFEGSHAR